MHPPSLPESRATWDRVNRLCSAAIRITAQHDLDLVLQEIVDSAREVSGATYAALGVLNHERTALQSFVVSGIDAETIERIGPLPTGKGVLGVLIKHPAPLRLNDIKSHAAAGGFPPHHPTMTSFLGVPIIGTDGPIGNLYLTNKRGAETFSEDDETYSVMLAAHAAVAVENARFHQERDRLMSELRNMQLSRERFFSMINHELRNALTAVYGWADLWIRRESSDPPRAAREVHECAERTLVLLDDLLDFSRLDADRLRLDIKEVDLLQVVRESVSTVEPAAKRKGVQLALRMPDDARWPTDPQRVRQILINLMTNAVRHSPEEGEVVVALELTPAVIRFEVIDHGEGIATEQQVVIFEAFERAGRQTERGTGLGLALSRKLARLMGGDLTVESQPGHGARFKLEIPRGLPS